MSTTTKPTSEQELDPEVKKRVTERYLKEYCADEQEAREMMEFFKTGPTWFEWWLDVLAKELSTQRQQVIDEVREIIENARKEAFPYDDDQSIINMQDHILALKGK